MLTFGGFLLLGGRLGDLYGSRRMFLAGLTLFTAASLACGLAQGQTLLIVARAAQGLGGAVVSAVSLSLIMNLFTEPGERARAMGVYGFVCAGGGSIGVLLGGLPDQRAELALDLPGQHPDRRAGLRAVPAAAAGVPARSGRHPAGRGRRADRDGLAAAGGLCGGQRQRGRLDLGAVAVAAGAAALLMALFLAIEARSSDPLMPLSMFRLRLATANVVAVLWAAAMFAWFFVSALYMQRVYDAMQVGLAFLPGNLIMAVFSLGLSAKLVMRFGIRGPLAWGLALAALGWRCSRARPSTAASRSTCCLRWCCWGWARAWPSIPCCWPP